MTEGTSIDMGDGFGRRLMRGKISEQDVVDIGAIGLALLLRKIPE